MNPMNSSIQFHVNGKEYVVSNVELGVSLNSWLRTSGRLTGTKVMCAEGGCGACVVTVTRPIPGTSSSKTFSANSCLLPLLSVDGCQITTTEGLIEDDGTYNVIQERVAHFNATQCGYCTPGFVMTMHSLLQRNPNPTQAEIEEEFDGNLCRCTGYRPIFDAMKSFASDADPKLKKICQDIEDLKICRKECKDNSEHCYKSCGRYEADGSDPLMHKPKRDMSSNAPKSLIVHYKIGNDTAMWIRPLTLAELTQKVKEFVMDGKTNIRYVVGNTSTGVYKNEGKFDVYIDSKEVKELYEITNSDSTLTVGANVSLNDLIRSCQTYSKQSEVFAAMAKHIRQVANVPVRNVGSWTGNIMIKKLHREFPSDIFTLFTAFNVKIVVYDCITEDQVDYNLTGDNNFMDLDLTGKVILACKIPNRTPPAGGKFKALSYKIMPRSQNAHAYVNAAFSASVTDGVIHGATISMGGISKDFVCAVQTEKYLEGKNVNLEQTLSEALEVFNDEVVPVSYSAVETSPEYRKSAAIGLFYKFYLYLCDMLPADIASTIDTLERPVTSSTRTYDSDASMFPVTEPIPKLSAIKQASGEAKYISDFTNDTNELFASYVMAEYGNADIEDINSSQAESMPGFHSVITAADLPPGVKNTFARPPFEPQPILVDGHTDFAGQPVAIVLADSEFHAEQIAKAVKVTYKNIGHAVCDLAEAITRKMFYDGGDDFQRGNADEAYNDAKFKISGRAKLGAQYHVYMEPQVSKAILTEDGFDLRTASQWQDQVQQNCAYIVGFDNNRVNVRTGRVGGAYGGKGMASWLSSAITLVSSYITGRPVRFHATLEQCMETFGRRSEYIMDYKVGVDGDGLLQAMEVNYYCNIGSTPNSAEYGKGSLTRFSDSGYYCPNWKLTAKNVRTNMPGTAACRGPQSTQTSMFMEMVLEHVARVVKQDPMIVKQKNLYKSGQVDLYGTTLTNFKLRDISQTLLANAGAAERQSKVDAFNKENKFKKRGLGFVPIKFLVAWDGFCFGAQVSIFASDGTVILTTGAIDVGQGVSTKLIQVAAYILGVPMDLIRISETTNYSSPNSGPSAGSITSEMCSKGVLECCNTLKARIDAAAEKLQLSGDTTWQEKVAKCFSEGVDLTAHYWVYPLESTTKRYNVCGAALSEVEMDIVTGEYALKRVDLIYDCGKSVNPEIDVGQAEGAFMFGVGYYTSEKLIFNPENGQLLTHNTWEYKPPASKDIPTAWNITFLKNDNEENTSLSSKAVGEPPLLLSSSVVFAIKRCIESFRNDGVYFAIDMPASVDNVQQLCNVKISDYRI